jgi:hypothetical protein
MAADPVFASVPRIGVADVSTANTNRDGTGTIADIIGDAGRTIPTAGTKIERIVIKSTGDPADSIVTIFLHDTTNYDLFDEFDIGNPAAASTTVEGLRMERAYRDLILPSGWKMGAAITVAPTAGIIKVFAFGADLT